MQSRQLRIRHGLHWGMPVLNPEHADRILSMGGRLLAQGGDTTVFHRHALDIEQQEYYHRDGNIVVKVVEACVAQETIRRRLHGLDGHLAIVGYGDTTWSQAASPTLTTVSYQLEQIAKETLKMPGTAHAGKQKAAELARVPARLIVRETSIRAAECRSMLAAAK